MAIYNFGGNPLAKVYDVTGSELSNAYDINGVDIYSDGGEPVEEPFAITTKFSSYEAAIQYAYNQMMQSYDSDTSAFLLFTDPHSQLGNDNVSFLDYIGNIVDWSKVWMIDLGDTVANHTPEQYLARNNPTYATMMEKMSNASIPNNRKMFMWGNHDMAISGESYGITDHAWLLSGYFSNSGATHYYDNDFVMVDSEHGIKYVCIGGWDYTETTGWTHYRINSAHMERIIEMLSVEDNYDIVLLSHIPKYRYYSYMVQYGRGTDFSNTPVIYEPFSVTDQTSLIADVSIDVLLADRNSHSSGSVIDSDGVSHDYDFTDCNGKILCGLSGHYHLDRYWYAENGGMLEYTFDGFLYSPRPIYFGLIDKQSESLRLWKINTNNAVFAYQLPFRRM